LLNVSKIIIAFFCFFFISYIFILSPVLLWTQNNIKAEVYQKINSNAFDAEFTFLFFNESEFKSITWVDESELIVNGVLYDVIRINKKENGDRIIKVFADKKEKKIINILVDNSNQNSSAKKCMHFLFQLFSQFHSPNEALNPINNFEMICNNFDYLNHYSFIHSTQVSRPPKLA
jgi:hypothetical protein